MMQPSGRAMHNGKLYELWGDELWEYSPDVETGRTTVRVVGAVPGNLINQAISDSLLLRAAPGMLAVLEEIRACLPAVDLRRATELADEAIAKAKRLSTPTGNPKYPDSPIGYCEDSDSLHECGRDRSVVGIHECGLPGCHLPSDSGDVA